MEHAVGGGGPPLHMRACLQPGKGGGSEPGHDADSAHALETAAVPVSQELLTDAENAGFADASELPDDERERARRAADGLARRQQDQEKLHRLFLADFTGPEYEIFAGELAAYGYPIILSWLRRGMIWKHCADRGRPLSPSDHERETIEDNFDERLELSLETVAEALKFFVERVLRAGRWSPEGGATITTYFIGSCLLVYPNVFRRWRREQQRWRNATVAAARDCPEGRAIGDLSPSDPAETITARMVAVAELRRMPEPAQRAAALVMDGMSFTETARILGTTDRAVEGRLYRYRQKRAT